MVQGPRALRGHDKVRLKIEYPDRYKKANIEGKRVRDKLTAGELE